MAERITRKKYEKARSAIQTLRYQLKENEEIVRNWEQAIQKVGNVGNQEVTAVVFDDDGSISIEAKPTQ